MEYNIRLYPQNHVWNDEKSVIWRWSVHRGDVLLKEGAEDTKDFAKIKIAWLLIVSMFMRGR